MSYKYKTIDLCAGIGGIRRGFEMTGQFENILSAEIDDYACATYEHLYGENPKNDLTSEAFMQKAIDAEYDVIQALNIFVNHANYLLRKMVQAGDIVLVNRGRYSKYVNFA